MKLEAVAVVGLMAVAPSLSASPMRFVRPSVTPEPVKVEWKAATACTLDGRSSVRVVADAPSSADWVRTHLKSFLRVEPSVTFAHGGSDLAEGAYRLSACGASFTLEAKGLSGVRHAFYTLRACLMAERGRLTTRSWTCPALEIEDAPAHAFRCLHLCWMPETSAWTMERLVRTAAYLKFSHVIVEFWGNYDSAAYPWFGWEKAVRVPTPELRRLVSVGRDLGVTLVPALNTLGHAAMARHCGGKHATLDMHPEFASLFEPREGWVWCLTNPEVRTVQKTLIREMYETFGRPGFFHIGCDESYPPSCPTCAATDWPTTVAGHVRFLRDEIASLGARTLMWHDMLISRKDPRWAGEELRKYPINGSSKESCERLLDLLPKDVVIGDWYYGAPLKDYPTWDYFMSKGFDVVACSWLNEAGTRAMGEKAAEKGIFGFMGTFWHHAYNPELYTVFLPSAEAAWGSVARASAIRASSVGYGEQTVSPPDFASVWRQAGWDMGGMDVKTRCGYSEDEIPRHTTTPW